MLHLDDHQELHGLERAIRLALLVAFADGELHATELERAKIVFAEVVEQHYGEDEAAIVRRQVRKLADDVQVEIGGMAESEIIELALDEAEEITDRDVQEIALRSALRICFGDNEVAKAEARAATQLAQAWGVSLRDLVS